MSGLLAGSYSLLATCFGGAALLSLGLIRYYEDSYDKERLASYTSAAGIAFALAMVVILPIDTFLVSSTTDNTTGLKYDWATPDLVASLTLNLKGIYYSLYGIVLLMCSGLVPFAYFFYESLDEDEPLPTKERVQNALKYTAFTVSVAFLLTILSLFIGVRSRDEKIDLGWFERLATIQGVEKAMIFIIGVLALLGQIILVGYTALGLSYLPISMIRGRGIPPQEVAEVERDLAATREKIRAIQAKYSDGRRPQGRDLTQLQELQRQERILIRRERVIQESTTGLWSWVLSLLRPLEVGIGFAGMALTVVILLSMVLSLIDRLANTICSSCGFLIDHQRIVNPINLILVRTARYFPVDLIFFAILLLWIFMSTASGIVRLGIRVLWVKLYHVRKSATAPQGLLFTCTLLMLSLLGLNYTVTVLAPQYSAFGNQLFCNNTITDEITNVTRRDCTETPELILPCALSAPAEICTPTVLSITMSSLLYNQPTLAYLLYISSWLFCGAFVLGLVFALVRRARRGGWDPEDDDEFADDEQESLLGNASRDIAADANDAIQGTARRALFGSLFG